MKNILFYSNNCNYSKEVIKKISESNVKDKWRALKCFTSEIKSFPHPRSEEGIATLASYRGIQSGFKYAEAFKIIRSFQK